MPASGNPRWRVKYYYAGKEKSLSLGTYPTISLKQARTQRDDLKRQLAQGIDPSLARKATRSIGQSSCSNSFETVGREWLLKQQAIWSESHWNTSLRRLERDVFPWLGTQPIDQTRPKDVLDVLKRVEGAPRPVALWCVKYIDAQYGPSVQDKCKCGECLGVCRRTV